MSLRSDTKSPGMSLKASNKAPGPTPTKRRNSTLWSETLDVHQKSTFSTKEITRQEVPPFILLFFFFFNTVKNSTWLKIRNNRKAVQPWLKPVLGFWDAARKGPIFPEANQNMSSVQTRPRNNQR